MKRSISLIALLLASAVICGCSSLGIYTPLNRRPENTSTNLCVGITIDNPPMSFKENDRITGMEAEFAARLAEELNLNLVFVCEKRDNLFSSLEDDNIDIAMGGLIISEEYASRIDYCSPYLIVGQLAITSIEKSREYRVRETLTFTRDNIGVKQLSRADLFVQKRCIQATRVFVSSKKDAEAKLLSGEIDVYIDDAPVIWDLVKRNRKHGFVTLQWKLTNDAMAWAVKRGNDELCSSVNEVLAKWRADGTINTVIRNWIPGAAKSRNNPRQP